MANFTLNVSDIRDEISSSKKNLNNYEESLNLYLSSILNMDSVWNDNNTMAFIETVKKDRLDLNEHIECLKKYIEIINNFCESLVNIVDYNFDISNLKKIEYNLDNINKLINYVNQIYNLVCNNYEIIGNMNVPIDFKYYSELKQMSYDWYRYKKNVYNLKINLINTREKIENLISNTKEKVNKFNVQYISSSFCKHSYKISSVRLTDTQVNNNNYSTNGLNGIQNINLNTPTYQVMNDYNQASIPVIDSNLNENNLNLRVDDKKSSLYNNNLGNLYNSSLEEINNLKQSSLQMNSEKLEDNNHLYNIKSVSTLDNKVAVELNDSNIDINLNNIKVSDNNSSIDLENTNIISNINQVKSTNNNQEVNLNSSTFSSVNNVTAGNNVQNVNLSSISVNPINKSNTSTNITDLNLNQ